MKTNISQHIKTQLSERKLTPSEDSWEKLSQMMNEEKSQSQKNNRFPKWWTFGIAASAIIFFSVMVINSFWQTEINMIQIVDTQKISSEITTEKNVIIPEEIQAEKVEVPRENSINPPQLAESNLKPKNKIKFEQEVKTIQIQHPKEKLTNPEFISPEAKMPEIKEQEIALISTPETEAETEKQKKYADPNMLLYSVEFKEAVTETKNERSRLVIIDFNQKIKN